jgi:hypothetical protein
MSIWDGGALDDARFLGRNASGNNSVSTRVGLAALANSLRIQYRDC